MLKLIVVILAIAFIVTAAEEFKTVEEIVVKDVPVNDSGSDSLSTEIEEGRLRLRHHLPFYGGLCKRWIYIFF